MKFAGQSYLCLIKKPWLICYLSIRVVAVSLMLYVFYNMYVGRAVLCSAGMSLLISAVIGSLYLKEKISKTSVLALIFIIAALVIEGWR